MLNKRIIVIGIGVAIVLAITALVVVMLNPSILNNNDTNLQNESAEPGENIPNQPVEPDNNLSEEDHSSVYIKNFELLFDDFSDSQALFINTSVINYANDNFGANEIYITDDYIVNRGNGSFGFNITDGQEPLFYVIAAKRPNDNVKVGFY